MTPNYVYSQSELAQQIEDRDHLHMAVVKDPRATPMDIAIAKALANECRVLAEYVRQTVFVHVVEVKG